MHEGYVAFKTARFGCSGLNIYLLRGYCVGIVRNHRSRCPYCAGSRVQFFTVGLRVSDDANLFRKLLASAAEPPPAAPWRESAGIARVGVRARGFFHLVILIMTRPWAIGRLPNIYSCVRGCLSSHTDVYKRLTHPRAREMRAAVRKRAAPRAQGAGDRGR